MQPVRRISQSRRIDWAFEREKEDIVFACRRSSHSDQSQTSILTEEERKNELQCHWRQIEDRQGVIVVWGFEPPTK